MYKQLLLITLLSFSIGNVQLSFGEYDYSSNSLPINYTSDSEIYGFQFASTLDSNVLNLEGAIGGLAESAGFQVSSSSNTGIVIGFSLSGASLPSGSHTLINLSFDVIDSSAITEICLTEPVFSGINGLSLYTDQGECTTYTPPPVELSLGEYNYLTNTIDLYASSPYDIAGFQFNASSSSLSLSGASGGAAENAGFQVSSSSNTGVVIGFSLTGSSIPAGENILITTLSFSVNSSQEDEICVSDTIFSGLGGAGLYTTGPECALYTPPPVELSLGEYNHSTNTIDLYASSPYDIAGFQFNASSSSLSLSGASGGAAENAGFQVSSSSDTGVVVGFSLTGSSIPAGENILITTLSFSVNSSEEAEICISDTIFSGLGGAGLYTTGPECALYTPPPVELSLGEYNHSTNTIDLYASSPYDIAGFQFNASSSSLSLSGASGGAAENAGFQVSSSSDTGVVVGFSLTGSSIPAGENILITTLSFSVNSSEEAEICISDTIFSGLGGAGLYTTGPECALYTPPPVELSLGQDLVNGMVQVNLTSPYDIAGFQFDVNSNQVTLSSSDGGAAESAGFQVSNGATTVIGFSLTGSVIGSGSFTLTELSFEGSGQDTICLDNVILSGAGGANLPFISLGCQEYDFNLLEIEIIEPSDNDLISGDNIFVSISSIGLSDGDHFHAYLDGEMMGMFYEDNFNISPNSSGYQLLEVKVANSSHEEYNTDGSYDAVEIGFVFPGDYNLDSEINILDLVATTQYILFGTDSDQLQLVGSDYNGDSEVNILDLVATVQFILFD